MESKSAKELFQVHHHHHHHHHRRRRHPRHHSHQQSQGSNGLKLTNCSNKAINLDTSNRNNNNNNNNTVDKSGLAKSRLTFGIRAILGDDDDDDDDVSLDNDASEFVETFQNGRSSAVVPDDGRLHQPCNDSVKVESVGCLDDVTSCEATSSDERCQRVKSCTVNIPPPNVTVSPQVSFVPYFYGAGAFFPGHGFQRYHPHYFQIHANPCFALNSEVNDRCDVAAVQASPSRSICDSCDGSSPRSSDGPKSEESGRGHESPLPQTVESESHASCQNETLSKFSIYGAGLHCLSFSPSSLPTHQHLSPFLSPPPHHHLHHHQQQQQTIFPWMQERKDRLSGWYQALRDTGCSFAWLCFIRSFIHLPISHSNNPSVQPSLHPYAHQFASTKPPSSKWS